MTNIRNRIWSYIIYLAINYYDYKEGTCLNSLLLTIRAILFPSTILHLLLRQTGNYGYNPLTSRWTIHGVSYEDSFFAEFVTQQNRLVVLTLDTTTKPSQAKINDL